MIRNSPPASRGGRALAALDHPNIVTIYALGVVFYQMLTREEISQTLPDGADLDAELRHLAGALARP